ncbi:hypothetical protein [Sphingobium sp. CAP-1]|uniref:hypothetical protein n=1 Tax=Sphingobium sp. CAP-1 TaxID=2676077 RepID=UPI0012BB1E70|nr:hypothetical protein [Sphingobium sp. CAP-1]QGP80598.1 hypothetical protein GL174_15875 [Sphingobium sp. CAP-1]
MSALIATGPAALLPLALLFPLAATIRQTWPGSERCGGMVSNAVSGATWLVPLIFIVPMCVGLMIGGQVSPLPQRTFTHLATDHGPAIALAGAIAVIIAELWLLLTPAMVVLRFSDPARRGAMRALVPLNLLLGGGFLAMILFVRA